jgi:hypothetical protein
MNFLKANQKLNWEQLQKKQKNGETMYPPQFNNGNQD